MLKFSADLYVNRPVAEVFIWLTNANNQRKFDKGSLAMEVLTPGTWHSGTQFRELRDIGGRKTTVLSEVSELEPNKRFVIRSKTGPEWVGVWEFTPEAGGTRLRWTGQMRMKGWARILEPLVGRQMRPMIERQFAQIPNVIESDLAQDDNIKS